jgi:hypothetical protein
MVKKKKAFWDTKNPKKKLEQKLPVASIQTL